MAETLAVVALDAADYDLARRWKCDNILLDRHGPLETFTHSLETPFTPEVWTSVATGLHPEEHEVRGDATDWDSFPLRLASNVTQFLPHEWRNQFGQPFRERGHEQEIHLTNESHVFEDGTATESVEEKLPETVFDIRSWLEADMGTAEETSNSERRMRAPLNLGRASSAISNR